MIYTVSEFAKKFETFVGDSTEERSEDFILACINWALGELPRVPKLNKLFSKHYTKNLDAKDHYRWNLNGDFRRLSDVPMLNFWTSTGGDICPLKICNLDTVQFYREIGVPYLHKSGTPCYYTIEQEDDNIYLVFDRPLNVPVIVDYIAYGYPKPVTSFDDKIEISAIAENLILNVMRTVFYYESDDFNFGGDISLYLDSKMIPEAQAELAKKWGSDAPLIIGES